MRVIGLTGSIGMGKSATARLFRDAGVPVLDADAVVHRLYGGEAVAPVEAAFPGVTRNGKIDRERLARRVLGDAAALRKLEAVVHPLVLRQEEMFVNASRSRGHRLAVLEIPLLLESGRASRVDVIVTVSAPGETQRARVLTRPGMTAEKFEALLARQMPDAEKRRRAHAVLDTSRSLHDLQLQVRSLIAALS